VWAKFTWWRHIKSRELIAVRHISVADGGAYATEARSIDGVENPRRKALERASDDGITTTTTTTWTMAVLLQQQQQQQPMIHHISRSAQQGLGPRSTPARNHYSIDAMIAGESFGLVCSCLAISCTLLSFVCRPSVCHAPASRARRCIQLEKFRAQLSPWQSNRLCHFDDSRSKVKVTRR